MKGFLGLGGIALLGSLVGNLYLNSRHEIPASMLNHESAVIPEIMSPAVGEQLMELLKEMSVFPSNVGDLNFYSTKHEHIGEAIPIGASGKCDHKYLVPSMNKTACVLPGRIDIGRHLMLYGGVEGLKEKYEKIISRVQSFGRYMFDLKEYPLIQNLFSSDQFQGAAKAVCPAGQQVLDPFQFNFIIQVPGQTVALHVDGVYFWGATRFQFPQWLLAVMRFSGLFEREFVHQVQVVGYVHQWQDENGDRDGEFVYYSNSSRTGHRVAPKRWSGVAVDGSKTVHAAMVYQPGKYLPDIDKSADNKLVYSKSSDEWKLMSNGKVLHTYSTDDLRISIVYRGRCFKNEEEMKKYSEFLASVDGSPEVAPMELETVLNTLKNDLVQKGRLSDKKLASLSRLDLALTLMDNYLTYPLPEESALPWNYCMLPRLVPQLTPIFDLIC